MMFHFARSSLSLRTRLVLIPPIFLVLGILFAIGGSLIGTQGRVAAESISGLEIGGLLINYALADLQNSPRPDVALDRLKEELSHVRHIRVSYRPAPGTLPGEPITRPPAKAAPEWFVHLFASGRRMEVFPIFIHAKRYGELVMKAEPADEVGEVWDELVFLICLLAVISVGIVLLTWIAVAYTLRPLKELVDGLNRLERGQFREVDRIRVAELQRVGEQFNQLAKSLARTEADNRLLIDRLMSIQESERKELARELHDEFGASLFGIRASASCLFRLAAGTGSAEARFEEVIRCAEAISTLADAIQKHNYRILERIQPIVLNEMGLYDALRSLAGAWSASHRGFSCNFSFPDVLPELGEDTGLAIYRIAQECLTNVARHSLASHVVITIDLSKDGQMTVRITDNGIGLPENFRFGFGFLGMAERARKLGGFLEAHNDPNGGALVEVSIPLVCSHSEIVMAV